MLQKPKKDLRQRHSGAGNQGLRWYALNKGQEDRGEP